MVNGFLLVYSSEFKSLCNSNDGTHMSGGFTTSLVCQDTSSDKDANGQSLCPHTSLNDLPHQTNRSESSKEGEVRKTSHTFCDVV